MANWRRREERKREIAALYEEGAQAYKDGKHIQHYPQEYNNNMNRMHWVGGYIAARDSDIQKETDDN
jgi:hypothetical protein